MRGPGRPVLPTRLSPSPSSSSRPARSTGCCHAFHLEGAELEAHDPPSRCRLTRPKPHRSQRRTRRRGPSSPGPPLPAVPAARALTWPRPRRARRGNGLARDARPSLVTQRSPKAAPLLGQPSQGETHSSAEWSSGPGRKRSLRDRKSRLPAWPHERPRAPPPGRRGNDVPAVPWAVEIPNLKSQQGRPFHLCLTNLLFLRILVSIKLVHSKNTY